LNSVPSETLEESPESKTVGVAKSKIVSSGVTAVESGEAGLEPTALVAVTVKSYAVPFVKPLTVAEVAVGFDTCVGVCAIEPMYGVIV
jgi:hypothetical protein